MLVGSGGSQCGRGGIGVAPPVLGVGRGTGLGAAGVGCGLSWTAAGAGGGLGLTLSPSGSTGRVSGGLGVNGSRRAVGFAPFLAASRSWLIVRMATASWFLDIIETGGCDWRGGGLDLSGDGGGLNVAADPAGCPERRGNAPL